MELSSNPDKITRDFFDSLLLETRYLDAAISSTEMELFGEHFSTPIMTAAAYTSRPLSSGTEIDYICYRSIICFLSDILAEDSIRT